MSLVPWAGLRSAHPVSWGSTVSPSVGDSSPACPQQSLALIAARVPRTTQCCFSRCVLSALGLASLPVTQRGRRVLSELRPSLCPFSHFLKPCAPPGEPRRVRSYSCFPYWCFSVLSRTPRDSDE